MSNFQTLANAALPPSRRTYRGRSLEEILPRIRAELGGDALVTRHRQGLVGGVAGFFQRALVEIEAEPGPAASAARAADAPQARPERSAGGQAAEPGQETFATRLARAQAADRDPAELVAALAGEGLPRDLAAALVAATLRHGPAPGEEDGTPRPSVGAVLARAGAALEAS